MIPSSRNVLRQYAFTGNRHKRFLEGYGKAAQGVALIRLDGGAPPSAAKVPAPAYGAGRCIGPGGVYMKGVPTGVPENLH